MFTGIVERTAAVAAVQDRAGGRRITVRVDERPGLPPWRPASLGESIAVNGVCLTVVEARAGGLEVDFDAVPETLRLTTLGALRSGDEANLERSLRVGDVLGGHYVTGHVDGVGTVLQRRAEGDQVTFRIEAPRRLFRQVIPKGSVAVDGISLTVVEVDRAGGWFSFAAIPHTLERTALRHRPPGSKVNLETDAFGKWVLHALEEIAGRGGDARLRELLEGGPGED
ncbi:MAG: riboflavin synthase [Planctomycetes bacterium]|nr:riboflavin synthase [Planctomycetota bacterium]